MAKRKRGSRRARRGGYSRRATRSYSGASRGMRRGASRNRRSARGQNLNIVVRVEGSGAGANGVAIGPNGELTRGRTIIDPNTGAPQTVAAAKETKLRKNKSAR